MAIWLAIVSGCSLAAYPQYSGGSRGGLICVAFPLLLLLGAHLEAGRSRWLPAFFLYGCLGSLMLLALPVRLGRYLLEPLGFSEYAGMTIASSVFVVLGGCACRAAARMRHRLEDARRERPQVNCQECGYLLYGLPEPRCPECGTPFDPNSIPPIRHKLTR